MKHLDISEVYDKKFFEAMIEYEMKSASSFARIIKKAMNPQSIIDIGSGNAIYLKAFHDLGIKDLIGFDGSKHAVDMSLLPGKVRLHDLKKPLILPRQYDLCLCMEVAEHLPPEYADVLIRTLAGLSRCVLFSAATIGQGGLGHINEQSPKYWIDLFRTKGFCLQKEITNQLRRELTEADVIWWISKNLMIFMKAKNKKSLELP